MSTPVRLISFTAALAAAFVLAFAAGAAIDPVGRPDAPQSEEVTPDVEHDDH